MIHTIYSWLRSHSSLIFWDSLVCSSIRSPEYQPMGWRLKKEKTSTNRLTCGHIRPIWDVRPKFISAHITYRAQNVAPAAARLPLRRGGRQLPLPLPAPHRRRVERRRRLGRSSTVQVGRSSTWTTRSPTPTFTSSSPASAASRAFPCSRTASPGTKLQCMVLAFLCSGKRFNTCLYPSLFNLYKSLPPTTFVSLSLFHCCDY
jgi:hypothetical protein